MELSLYEVNLLIAGTYSLEQTYRKKENDRHGEPLTELRKLDRAKLKAILTLQDRLISHKFLLEKTK
jgi:hypothetical protein